MSQKENPVHIQTSLDTEQFSELNSAQPVEQSLNAHYSEKGSHFKSSQYWKTRRRLERQGIDDFMRYVPMTDMLPDRAYIIRRQMRRTPKDGR